ncbi:DUF917 domain-containing protein [Geosporobacter ferrireducens]|uniref:DUF917 domain-containing protein n=1 Tax=Geosporobacter ferrireducens TaxID=1424294 RepID=UPI00139B59BA|nr:DUF917 domain-containing protein [Geosporobacter ferrireducens]MTI58368.1 DUF917 domain-containing protein [Geosporobacter ferrireducens]
MKKLNRQDLVDILYGCTILGTGGGGSLEKGIDKIDQALKLGKEFVLVDFDELQEDDLIATPYACGAISPETEEERKKYERLPIHPEEPQVLALREMEKYLGQNVKAVISTELGGGNTAIAFYSGAMAGKYIVDGDPAGRSVPELQHSTYFLNDIPIYPMAVVNQFGEAAVITKVVDDYRAEALVRSLAIVSKNNIAVVDHVQKSKELKNAVIRGAISYAWQLGKAYREAKESELNVVEAVIEVGKGVALFKGRIRSNEWGTVDGFTVGDVIIEGIEDFEGEEYKIWYKNENIIAWKNGKIHTTVPDLICIMDVKRNEPIINPYFIKGMKVAVFALPAPEEWTTPKGLEVFGPESFGFDVEWKPICKG